MQGKIAGGVLHNFSCCRHIHFRCGDATVVGRFEKLCGVDLPILFWSDLNFSINQADFYALNARLASEVLLHPVCSKVSSHAFDAHLDMLDLRLRYRREGAAEKQQ